MTDFNKILDKAKELEAKMKESQQKIKEIRVEGISGSNSVKIVLDGEGEMQKIEISNEERIKLGGFVVEDSVTKDGEFTLFTITDGNKDIDIVFDGFVPELFQENMGVILDGVFDDNLFLADDMLVKHDNEYVSSDGETYNVENYSEWYTISVF